MSIAQKGGRVPTRHRVGPWSPVISVELGPGHAAGDTVTRTHCNCSALSLGWWVRKIDVQLRATEGGVATDKPVCCNALKRLVDQESAHRRFARKYLHAR